MKLGLVAVAVLAAVGISAVPAIAGNTPCSGKKGGIARCQGEKFVCKDGSISASKQSCSASAK